MAFRRNLGMKAALSPKTAMASPPHPHLESSSFTENGHGVPPQLHHESGSFTENGHGVPPYPCYESNSVTAKMTTAVISSFLWKRRWKSGALVSELYRHQATLQIVQSKVGFEEVRAS
jgi:hypothetical protein